MTNYNTTSTAYRNFNEMVKGIAGDWYFEADPDAGYEAIQKDIASGDFSDVLEFFTDWNKNNPDEQVTSDSIKDVSVDLVEWYKDNCHEQDEIDYSEWLSSIHDGSDDSAYEIDGSDPREIARFVMQGVLDNDHINNGGEPAVWGDANDAVSVYSNDNYQPANDSEGELIVWGEDEVAEAETHVEQLMRLNGNL